MDNVRRRGSRLIKNSVLNLINSSITMVVTAVTSIVVARLLKPSNYGIYNLVLWFTGIFTWATGMGLVHAVTKYVSEYRGRKSEAVVNSIIVFVLKIELGLTLLVTAVLFFFKTEIADYFFSTNEAFFFMLAFIGLVPGIVTAVFSATIEGIQKFEYFTYFHLIVTPVSFVTKLVVLYLGYRIEGLLVVSLVFSFINTVYFFIVLKKEKISLHFFKNPARKEVRQKIWRYNWTVAAILVTAKVVWDKSENFFLGRFCSAVQVGFFNLAFNVAHRFMSVMPETFWRVLFPAMSEYFGSGDDAKIKRLFYLASRYIAFFSFPVGVAGIVLAYPIIHFLYGHDYIGAKYALQIIFFSTMFTSLSKPGSAILYGTERQAFIFKYTLVLAVINIILGYFLIRKYGAVGAAACYGIVTMAGSVGGLIYTCRAVGLTYPFRSVFKVILSSIIMGIAMALMVGQKAELLGFILSIPVGITVYFVSSIVLGSFEEEDYILMDSAKSVLPDRFKKAADGLTGLLSSLKEGENR
jgi:O-antigen/teichoic acid export membrane protein